MRFHQPTAFALLAILVLCAIPQSVRSQSPSEEDTLRNIMSTPTTDAQTVEDRLNALIDSTKRARQERQAATAQTESSIDSGNPISDTAATYGGSPVAPEVQPNPNANSARSMSEIRERIRILQKLRRDRRINEASQMSNQLPGGVRTPAIEPPGGDVVPPNPSDTADPPPAIVESTLSSIDQSLAAEETPKTVSSDDVTDPSVAASRILPNPVNTLALGESLYRTGNFQSALKALKSVDTNTLSQSDRTWLDLLVALCQRRTGEYETAEGTLREIANEESSDYPVKAAKWWLKHAKASHETLTKMNALTAEFDSLLERSKSHVKY